MRTRLLALLVLVVTVAAASFAASGKMNYIYKRGSNTWMRIDGNLRSFERIVKKYEKYSPELIWVEQNGREYVITSVPVLEEARKLFGEMDAKAKPLRAVEARLRPHEREMEKVEEQLDTLSDSFDDEDLPESRRRAIEEKIQAAEKQMRAVEERMRVVERELERLEKEMEKHEAVIEARFEQLVDQAIRQGKAERVD